MIDWRQHNSSFFSALQVERSMVLMILTLIVLVATFNIASSLIMLVKDKGRDIGILRTMGATRGAIMRVFLITGFAIGAVGDLVGFVLGLIVCLNIESLRQFMSWLTNTEIFKSEIYFLSRLPAESGWRTAAVVVMTLALAARDALSVVACGTSRSSRSAALRVMLMADKATPVVLLHAVERRYHQGCGA
jgi:lipoprotein-releasing system permease protein